MKSALDGQFGRQFGKYGFQTRMLFLSSSIYRQFDESLFGMVKSLITLTESNQNKLELEFADEVMVEFNETTENPDYFQLWYENRGVLEKSRSLKGGSLEFRAAADSTPSCENSVLIDGRPGRQVALSFIPRPNIEDDEAVVNTTPQPTPVIEMRLVVARSREDLDSVMAQLRWSLGIAGLLLAAGLSLTLRGTVRKGMMPLQSISSRIERLDPSQLDARIELADPPVELAPVVARLNELPERLEKAFRKESRFSADVAHELRTPIVALRSLADVAPRIVTDRPAIGQFMEDVHDIALPMNSIVDTLISLARYDSDRLNLQVTTLALRQTVLDVQPSVAAAHSTRATGFELAIPDDVLIIVDEEKFRLIVRNLIDNAYRYAPHDTPVFCRSTIGDAGKIALTVANAAPDLDPADLALMFDRFWRKDAARTSGSHVGLGLSLVQALTQALNLTIEVDLTGGIFEACIGGLIVDQSAAAQVEADSIAS